jgi:long-chain acyl-CoA synthetase
MTYRNLAELHHCQAERLGRRTALRYKRDGLWHDVSWENYRADALACAAALAEVGIRPGDRVGLLGENCVDWLVADMGILTAGAVNVSPHAPLAARQIHFQLSDAGVRWVFVSTPEQLDKVLRGRGELPTLEGVIVFQPAGPTRDVGTWRGFLQRGRQALARRTDELAHREAALGPDDLATIMYTSGTTGNPKGVMLTHGNLLSNALACQQSSPRNSECVLLSWLPYSHIYARTVDHYLTLLEGVTACLADSPETVVENLAEVAPTHISAVPRFYEKVLAAVATADPQQTNRRLKYIFGPRIDWLSAGGAPLSHPVAQAYQQAGLLVLQGYGLTESSPVISFNRKDRHKLDTVGPPIPGVEVKIAPDGEVLTRGPHVMKGYWNNPEATAEAIKDGWLYTGDLGRLDEDGFLSITGRKKELLVLSNGKKVVPSYIEGLLVASECIEQAAVDGEGRPFLTALIVPNWENVRRRLRSQGVELDHAPLKKLTQHPAVHSLLEQEIESALVDVANWEQVRQFVVLDEPFTVASDELTVSLKLRRNVVLSRHAEELRALYANAGPVPAGAE